MRYQFILVLLLAFSIAVAAQEPTTPATVLSTDKPIDAQTIRLLRIPVVADTPSSAILMTPGAFAAEDRSVTAEAQPVGQSTATDTFTIDLEALRSRVGTVTDIRVIREDRSVAASPESSEAISLNRGDILAVRRDQMEPPVIESEGVTTASSSTILYTIDASGHTRELGLVHRSAGLHWRAERTRFAGELLVGILDRENPQAQESLQGVTIAVQLLAPPGALDRTDLALARIGSPFERVAVEIERSSDPFTIDLISQIDPDLPRAELRVNRPHLALSAPNAIQGLGVEEAVMTVSGIDANLHPGETITLDLDNGWLADRTVVVGETGTASTRIRSDWLGSGTLRVVAPSIYQAAPKEIRYTLPVRFMTATLIGGMLGALVLVHMLKRKESRSKRSYSMDWIIGVIIGSGATTMAYAGMKLPEWIPVPPVLVGEAAPFALAFICAAAGTALIHSITGTSQSPATG